MIKSMKITKFLKIISVTAVIICASLYSCTNINYRDFGVNDVGNIVGFLLMGTKGEEIKEIKETDEYNDNTENAITGDLTNPVNYIDPENSENSQTPNENTDITEITQTPTVPPEPAETEPPTPSETTELTESIAETTTAAPEFVRLGDVFRDAPSKFESLGFPSSLQMTDTFKTNLKNLDSFLTKDFENNFFYVMTTEPKFFKPSNYGGGILSDTRLYRTQLIAKAYNVNLGVIAPPRDDIIPLIERKANAGEYTADIICAPLDIQARLIQKGLLVNLKKIPFVNLNAEYYNQSAAEAFSVNNNIYGVVSDVTFEPANIYAMFYNRSLIKKYNLESPADFYNNGEWTYDNMFSLVKSFTAAASDVNNPAETELYGIGFNKENNDIINGLFISSGNKYFTKRNYDFPYLSFSNDKTLKIIDALTHLFSPQSENGMLNYLYADDENQRNTFESGKVLFSIGKLDILPDITDIDFDWGILPVPTADGKITGLSFTSRDAMSISVLKSAQNSEMSGVMTEALAMLSYKYIRELYVQEQMLHSLRNVDSVNTLSEIIYGETFNQYSVFSTADEIYNATVGILKTTANRNGAFEDLYERNSTALNDFFRNAKYFERN